MMLCVKPAKHSLIYIVHNNMLMSYVMMLCAAGHTEQVTHFTLWCLMSGPLLISTDLGTISNASLSILQHAELIAVNQDPNGLQGVCTF